MKVVIQCGGKGTRLRPYTMVLPKPLMPVKSEPVLELLLKWLRRNDVREVFITTGYLGELIRSFCGDGRQWSMKIEYTEEREPLGTIGPLAMLRDQLDSTFMVINGDVLTDLSIGAFLACHHRSKGLVTVATARRETPLEFGVIEACDGRVVSFKEKPSLTNLMSMGVYCMEPGVLEHIPRGVPFGFDDLMYRLLAEGEPVHTYQHDGLWLDIGRVADFQNAQALDWDEQAPAHERLVVVS
ncbi:nucleotidyltransferase family protein [Albimonas pacifica]|uniref:Mannose-1-phosphate guanylyltransferase n=1 Tax=Albimonas pacifica TaxID=1114924 RepID=A0A1I3IWS0_9RHOB|nr:nucleotidyltransferase family protein [Albimonas pacifica]SFI52421.1 mannose-1-phosphate guanylyltransferase [Albimonas pacifica]